MAQEERTPWRPPSQVRLCGAAVPIVPSLTASPKTMLGAEESAEQKLEEGSETPEDVDPSASQASEAGLEEKDRDEEKAGYEEGRDTEANEKAVSYTHLTLPTI